MTKAEEIKTFQECLEIAKNSGGSNHLMLGNGFSISLFPDIFNYKSLSEKITSERTKNLFQKFQTNDFEYVMHKLDDALEVMKIYSGTKDIRGEVEKDLAELKATLISVISDSHPATPNLISEKQYESCRQFLSHFEGGKMYSFNYDLILYWVLMHFIDESQKKLKCDDGFRKPGPEEEIVTWEIGQEKTQSLYYIHGAMHIFSNENGIEKYTWTNKGIPLAAQVKQSIEERKYPVFISEGKTEHKLKRVRENSYLGRAFSSLKSIRGNLFIFGHSLRDEDSHVFKYINKRSSVTNIFIGIHSGLETANGQKIKNKVDQWRHEHPSKKYIFYRSETANIWDGFQG